jgi:hypothetical protein
MGNRQYLLRVSGAAQARVVPAALSCLDAVTKVSTPIGTFG